MTPDTVIRSLVAALAILAAVFGAGAYFAWAARRVKSRQIEREE